MLIGFKTMLVEGVCGGWLTVDFGACVLNEQWMLM